MHNWIREKSSSDRSTLQNLSHDESFGQALRIRREAVGLSRKELAHASGVSEATIKFVETERCRPSKKTLLRLLQLPILGFQTSGSVPAHLRSQDPFAPQVYEAPPTTFWSDDFDRLCELQRLDRVVSGDSGVIPLSSLFLLPQSASNYLQYLTCSWEYGVRRQGFPFAAAAQAVTQKRTTEGLVVIVLGTGDGLLEVRFISELLRNQKLSIQLWFVDLNDVLLRAACLRAATDLRAHPVRRLALLTDYYGLPQNEEILSCMPPDWQRLVVALDTVFHLDDPSDFFDNLVAKITRPWDLFLFDAPVLEGTKSGFCDKRAVDSYLSNFLRVPFVCSSSQPKQLVFSEIQDCVPEACFLRNIVATLSDDTPHVRSFSVLRDHAVVAKGLHYALSESGFGNIDTLPMSHEGAVQQSLHVCVRNPTWS
jgi:transcriptional regulator with XRE-family HTH domain